MSTYRSATTHRRQDHFVRERLAARVAPREIFFSFFGRYEFHRRPPRGHMRAHTYDVI